MGLSRINFVLVFSLLLSAPSSADYLRSLRMFMENPQDFSKREKQHFETVKQFLAQKLPNRMLGQMIRTELRRAPRMPHLEPHQRPVLRGPALKMLDFGFLAVDGVSIRVFPEDFEEPADVSESPLMRRLIHGLIFWYDGWYEGFDFQR